MGWKEKDGIFDIPLLFRDGERRESDEKQTETLEEYRKTPNL